MPLEVFFVALEKLTVKIYGEEAGVDTLIDHIISNQK